MSRPTNVNTFLEDLDGGSFIADLGDALSAAAAGAVAQQNFKKRAGKVVVTFEITQIGESAQVHIAHTLQYVQPTARGEISEKKTTETPMHVGRGGALSLFQEDQHQLFNKQGQPANNTPQE